MKSLALGHMLVGRLLSSRALFISLAACGLV